MGKASPVLDVHHDDFLGPLHLGQGHLVGMLGLGGEVSEVRMVGSTFGYHFVVFVVFVVIYGMGVSFCVVDEREGLVKSSEAFWLK